MPYNFTVGDKCTTKPTRAMDELGLTTLPIYQIIDETSHLVALEHEDTGDITWFKKTFVREYFERYRVSQ